MDGPDRRRTHAEPSAAARGSRRRGAARLRGRRDARRLVVQRHVEAVGRPGRAVGEPVPPRRARRLRPARRLGRAVRGRPGPRAPAGAARDDRPHVGRARGDDRALRCGRGPRRGARRDRRLPAASGAARRCGRAGAGIARRRRAAIAAATAALAPRRRGARRGGVDGRHRPPARAARPARQARLLRTRQRHPGRAARGRGGVAGAGEARRGGRRPAARAGAPGDDARAARGADAAPAPDGRLRPAQQRRRDRNDPARRRGRAGRLRRRPLGPRDAARDAARCDRCCAPAIPSSSSAATTTPTAPRGGSREAGAIVLTRRGRLLPRGGYGPLVTSVGGLRMAGYESPNLRLAVAGLPRSRSRRHGRRPGGVQRAGCSPSSGASTSSWCTSRRSPSPALQELRATVPATPAARRRGAHAPAGRRVTRRRDSGERRDGRSGRDREPVGRPADRSRGRDLPRAAARRLRAARRRSRAGRARDRRGIGAADPARSGAGHGGRRAGAVTRAGCRRADPARTIRTPARGNTIDS